MVKDSNFWSNHPELQSGEIFLTNIDSEHLHLIQWKTKREGKIAYDCDGQKFGEHPDIFPIFVKREELEKTAQGREVLEKC